LRQNRFGAGDQISGFNDFIYQPNDSEHIGS